MFENVEDSQTEDRQTTDRGEAAYHISFPETFGSTDLKHYKRIIKIQA